MLDVNFNRAAEGLRTLEDAARVVFEDSTAAGWTKSLRHALAKLAEGIPRAERLAARAVHSDAGTSLTEFSERRRDHWPEVVAAATERVAQSLRVIEEVSKSHFGDLSASSKQLRYRSYDQLARIERRLLEPDQRFPAPPLYVLVNCAIPVDAFVARLKQLVNAGVGMFQIRDKNSEARTIFQYSRAAVAAVGAERIVVNDRVDIALASGARGVHVGQDDLPVESVLSLTKGKLWVGVSTHNIDQAREAQGAGADYIGCGPTFPSTTKQFAEFAGLDFLQEVAAEIELPAYAIGGIDVENVQRVLDAGLSRVAVSNAVWAATDSCSAATSFARLLELARSTKV